MKLFPIKLVLATALFFSLSTAAEKNTKQAAQNSASYKTVTLSTGASVTWIKDNPDEKLMPRDLFSDASDSLYNSMNLPNGVPASVSVFLLKVNGEYILFDAGLGFMGGNMMASFKKIGVSPDQIKMVYLTHLHGDHIGGLVNKTAKGMEKVFKNATIYLCKAEHDAWMNDIPKNDLQKAILGTYKDNLKLFSFGDSLPNQVLSIDAVGHTPGHTAFRYNELLIIGDLMHGYALQIKEPRVNSNYDMDKPKSAESRKRLIDYAKENGLFMAGMHLPAPGMVK